MGSSPPIGLWSMQNRTCLVLLRPIFGEKMKTAPPQRKLGAEVVKYMSWIGLKKRLNVRFWPKKSSQFRWRPIFFFLETTCFWAEKTFEFPSLNSRTNRVILIQEQWKFGSRSFAVFSLFQKSPPPPPPFSNPGYAPAPPRKFSREKILLKKN